MLKNLDPKNKNIVFVVIMLITLYMAYSFSFKHAIAAVQLNHQLEKEQHTETVSDASFPQISRKNDFYNQVLKAYKVKKEDRENRLWQSISGVALAKGVEINFSPNVQASLVDTTEVKKGVVSQQFTFKGNYSNMVKLLDTLSKSPGIGKICSLNLQSPKTTDSKENNGKLSLQLSLKGMEQ